MPAETNEKYADRLLKRVRALFKGKAIPNDTDLQAIIKEERGRQGGLSKAAKGKADSDAGKDTGKVAASDEDVTLAELAWEDRRDLLQQKLSEAGVKGYIVKTYDNRVIYMTGGFEMQPDGGWDETPHRIFERTFTITDAGKVELGDEAVEVVKVPDSYEPVSADDAESLVYTLAEAFRLADTATLPKWLQIHKIGTWAVEHASAGKIELTREQGNEIISNFNAGVLRRDVPLDERHQTDNDGHAFAWFKELRWGSEGQGLSDDAEPDGSGTILYGRVDYTDLGEVSLSNRRYQYISPQYDRDYVDKETGKHHGWVLLAAASTNSPFLRLRSIQGEPCPEPVALTDGVTLHQQEDSPMPGENTPQTVSLADYQALQARVAAQEAKLAEQERKAFETRITDRTKQAIRDGVPPAIANEVRTILLAMGPQDATSTQVALDDSKPDAKVSLQDAISGLLDKARMVPFGTMTGYDDTRPANTSLGDTDAKETEATYAKLSEEWGAEVRGTPVTAEAAQRKGPEGVAFQID